MKTYYGEALTVDEIAGVNWARLTYFYYNYYIYTYVTGKSAADLYLSAFLKAGSPNFPIDILKNADVDIQSPEPIIKV